MKHFKNYFSKNNIAFSFNKNQIYRNNINSFEQRKTFNEISC